MSDKRWLSLLCCVYFSWGLTAPLKADAEVGGVPRCGATAPYRPLRATTPLLQQVLQNTSTGLSQKKLWTTSRQRKRRRLRPVEGPGRANPVVSLAMKWMCSPQDGATTADRETLQEVGSEFIKTLKICNQTTFGYHGNYQITSPIKTRKCTQILPFYDEVYCFCPFCIGCKFFHRVYQVTSFSK